MILSRCYYKSSILQFFLNLLNLSPKRLQNIYSSFQIFYFCRGQFSRQNFVDPLQFLGDKHSSKSDDLFHDLDVGVSLGCLLGLVASEVGQGLFSLRKNLNSVIGTEKQDRLR